MKILITGATGLLGKKLGLELFRKGHDLVVISRSEKKAKETLPFAAQVVVGDLMQAPLLDLPAVDAVIHLLGEGIADKRWSQDQKTKLWDSRILGTRHLLASLKSPPKVFLSASAIGYYGDRVNEELTENSTVGSGFLPELCAAWEAEAQKIADRTRLVLFRIGIVLAKDGGALAEMSFPFRAGVGSALGSGQQKMSWIHIDDLVRAFEWSLTADNCSGIVNAVAAEPVSNQEFSRKLANVLQRPLGPSVPKLALKALFGELSVVLLSDQNIKSRLSDLGFKFKFSSLQEAFLDLLKEESQQEDVYDSYQFLPYPIEKVFQFFCDANNLERITPDTLNFKILNVSSKDIQQGTLIDYSLKIHGVPVRWKTEIEQWNPPFEFVDRQLKGPYSLWHHTHSFEAIRGGTLMRDRVRFKVPLGYLGWLTANAWVKSDVQNIFAYRKKVISEIQHEIFS